MKRLAGPIGMFGQGNECLCHILHWNDIKASCGHCFDAEADLEAV
jgi:hypothetical protein